MLRLLRTQSSQDIVRLPFLSNAVKRRPQELIGALLDRARTLGRGQIDGEREKRESYLLRKDDIRVRLTEVQQGIECVDTLVSRLYRQRGYDTPPSRSNRPGGGNDLRRITLEACNRNRTVGTVSINLDGPGGLDAEDLFREEIAPFRRGGARLCEFTRLALELANSEKNALACLFHMAYIFAYRIHHASDLFIEVNPRHAAFYLRRLRFKVIGEQRTCRRVNAPAVLLHKRFREISEDLMRFGGFKSGNNNSFYAAGLAPWEENDVLEKITQMTATTGRRAQATAG